MQPPLSTVKARFETAGQFAWHCHIVEHEDNEMMRPYRIGPRQPGQPDLLPAGGRGEVRVDVLDG